MVGGVRMVINKHEFIERPEFTREFWESFEFKVLMGGMGDDTAMLIAELYERGFEPDEIVFCDTGSEFDHTYEFIKHLEKWCKERNWSKVVTLRKLDKFDKPLSVISLCKDQNTLPAVAFGSKSCSLRFKVETADKYFNNNPKCHNAWGIKKKGVPLNTYTGKILRLVGLNADEPVRVNGWSNHAKWIQSFPLFDWGIGEAESEAVERVGLYYPGKSSCTVCPNMTHSEIAMLRDNYPDKFKESLAIEARYIEVNKRDDSTTKGLGRSKTWSEKLKEYDADPGKYKRMTDTKPCECGR